MNYDFSVLSDYEFEKLVNKLLANKDVVVEQYRVGRDQGFDGFTKNIPSNAMIQVKHYLKTGFAGLKRKIEDEELSKIRKAKPSAYVLATSLNLGHAQVSELRGLIESEVSDVTVLGEESISSLLDNDSKTLRSMVKLWCGSADIARHVLNPERMSRFLELNSRISDKRNVFVETPDFKKVLEQLHENHVVVIAGEPGVGKTTLAEYLCYFYLEKDFDVQIFEGDFSREKYDLSNKDEKVLFYFDDFLGSNYYNCVNDKSDSAIVNFIEQLKKEPNKRFILTSRTHIVNRAQEYSQSYRTYGLSKKQYIVDVGQYDELTKAKILYNHLRICDIDVISLKELVESREYYTIIRHKNFNPRLIEFISRTENFEGRYGSYLSFVKATLDNPREIWENCFRAQLNEFQRLLIKLVVVNGGSSQEDDLKLAYRRAIRSFSIQKPEQESIEYDYVLRVCEKCMLKRFMQSYYTPHKVDRAVVSVFNPSVSDYLLPLILDNIEELEVLCDSLRTAESLVIFARIEESVRKDMMRRLLSKYAENEWPLARVWIIGMLENLEYAGTVYTAINKGFLKIDPDNWNCLQSIIIFSVNTYDWSEVLLDVDVKVYNNLSDYNELYESYQNCPFCQQRVLEKLHKNLIVYLQANIEERILEKFDCEREIDESDVWDKCADYMGNVMEEFSCISEDDCDIVSECVNTNRIVDEVNSAVQDNHSNDYYDEDVGNDYHQQNEIDKMFMELI